MKIFLTGMPGCGKTTFGRLLAKKLNLSFIDLDDAIIEEQGTDINTIFSEKGEDYFRELEKNMLEKTIKSNGSFVLATGGGAPCFHNGMKVMNDHGLTFYLQVPVRELARRMVAYGTDERPLLKDIAHEQLLKELEGKLKSREMYYLKADCIVDAEKWEPEIMINVVKSYINSRSQL